MTYTPTKELEAELGEAMVRDVMLEMGTVDSLRNTKRIYEIQAIIADRKETHFDDIVCFLIKIQHLNRNILGSVSLNDNVSKELDKLLAKLEGK